MLIPCVDFIFSHDTHMYTHKLSSHIKDSVKAFLSQMMVLRQHMVPDELMPLWGQRAWQLFIVYIFLKFQEIFSTNSLPHINTYTLTFTPLFCCIQWQLWTFWFGRKAIFNSAVFLTIELVQPLFRKACHYTCAECHCFLTNPPPPFYHHLFSAHPWAGEEFPRGLSEKIDSIPLICILSHTILWY